LIAAAYYVESAGMKSIRAALSVAALLAATGVIYAQGSTRTINLTAEQRHVIKEVILKEQNVAKADAGLSTSVGDVLPASVITHSFPSELGEKIPQVKSHVYIVKGNEVVVVNPRDRVVQEVID
jgi:hypothetical protein